MITRRQTLKSLGAATLLGTLVGNTARPLAGMAPPDIDGVRFIRPDDPLNGPNFNAYFAKAHRVPELRALCDTAEGVAATLRWARDAGVPFAIRSTGHDFIGNSQHDTLVIDTSPLNHIALSDDRNRVTVGAGARNGAVSLKLAEASRGLGGGTFESVGMAGTTLGGGFGYFARHAGLLCDQLENLRLVDAEGTVREVDAEREADLFWACRGGGGGSFGIVTDLTFRTFPLPQLTHINAPILVDAVPAAHIIHEWQSWIETLPRGICLHLNVHAQPRGQFLLAFTGFALASRAVALGYFQDLIAGRHPVYNQWILERPPIETMEWLYGVPHHVTAADFLSRSHIIAESLSLSAVAGILYALASYPMNAANINFEAVGGATADIAITDSAFPHRNAKMIVHVQKHLQSDKDLEISPSAVQAVHDAFQPHATGGIYVNYPEADLPNWAEAYWGPNLSRMKEIKRAVDPENVFRHRQSVPVV